MLLKDLAGEQVLAAPEFETEIAGLSADSRTVSDGYLFAALKGATSDGSRFIADARAAGASAVLVGQDVSAQTLESLGDGFPVIVSDDPRRTLALMAARFHAGQPETMVAVTGTSGKTSVAVFARQIFAAAGHKAASLGTIGTVTSAGANYGGLTTPDPVSLHQTLARLAHDGITHAALEASSHGLDQRRLDGVRLAAAGFTNLGRDHLDYHADVEDYLAAKLRLFDTLLPAGKPVVLEPEAPYADRVMAVARERGLPLFTVGDGGADLALTDIRHDGFMQVLTLQTEDGPREIRLPLAGRFQVSNALIAAGLAIAGGVKTDDALEALESLEGAPGRLELVGESDDGALVFVDYAHKPDALDTALAALRPFTKGRLIVVFGAGGDRDAGKRPLMGEAAARRADVVIVTDDNPRSEDPAAIRSAILEAAPGALEIGDRRDAIEAAVGMLQEGDVLCIAGKGHEPGQTVGTEVLPFSDHEVARTALAAIAESDLFAASEDDAGDFELDLAALLEDAPAATQDVSKEDAPTARDGAAKEDDALSLDDELAAALFDELGADAGQAADVAVAEGADADEGRDSDANAGGDGAADAGEGDNDALFADGDDAVTADAPTTDGEDDTADAGEPGQAETEPEADDSGAPALPAEETEDRDADEADLRAPEEVDATGENAGEEPDASRDFADAVLPAAAAAAAASVAMGSEPQTFEPLPEPDDSRPLWTLEEMVAATGGRAEGVEAGAAISGLSIDSRTIQPGEAFVAIAGERFDGHDFAGAALEAGAALALVSEARRADLPKDGRYLIVADALEGLRDLARASRARSQARIVAVTGSVGKTSTKDMLKLALDASGKTHAPVASFNNHWGVPLTLARMPADTAFGIFEIGMNHAGEITPLVKMVRPHVAVITTVAAVHLEFFGSVERIAQAKGEIFLGLEPGGLALLNRDNDQFDLLTFLAKTSGVRRIATFGREGPADAQADRVSAQVACTSISGHVFNQPITYKVGAPGQHLVTNSLAVLAAVAELGGDLALAGLALANFHAPKGRGAQIALRLPEGSATVIDESYNANPASVRAALSLLKETPISRPGRRIAVLGDMLELGEAEGRLHAELLGPVNESDADLVYCVGERMHELWDILPKHLRGAYSEEAASMRPLLLEDVRPGDVIMIKGSLGTRMGPLVEALKREFPVEDDGAE
jgi:UDP-N-acetylmuramoyl-L-alanyl-D-glutamate--2,6-diaminopimelate ligase